ncbi:peptidase M15B and M15C, D,D-carboxypeptidase VanY/endolysin [Calothrix parasitica NIES-267]|uniref:Peptidase M15B and M15C, D,D-carboxypeptidase VanY/endolysin n=1 Tax=Calothrix parasitica NIES-267 TaxID=1973488 RepID=A0A1Z4LQY0_9CYAN|nr:peptidase M15B and M15C, D,D-carboxypeptidase VanY/endolysin [Calothrix parasitica NIES-267]
MNNEFYEEAQNSTPSEISEDIPQALRDTPDTTAPKLGLRPLFLAIAGVMSFAVLAAISGLIFYVAAPKNIAKEQPSPTNPASPNSQDRDSANKEAENDSLLGHLQYQEAPESEIVAVNAGGKRIRLRKSAGEKFKQMVNDARKAGVRLAAISGFRTVEEQNKLFFNISRQRNQRPAERASVSAPPGHSEHHTGYAVDIGDGAVPATNLSEKFENTKAFKWLEANAAKYGFELSFPKDNPQGVSYEPWHWRFVGDKDSLETFYQGRDLKPIPTPES